MIRREDFSRQRHVWLRAVMGCRDLTAAAKTVGYALVQEFANRDSGRCNPAQADVAEFLGMSVRHLRDQLKALEALGFLRVFRGVGRGRPSFVRFVIPAGAAYGTLGGGGRVVPFRQRAERSPDSPVKATENRNCGVEKPEPECRVLIGTKENQNARASGEGDCRPEKGALQAGEVIVREADRWPVECWRRWLRDHGLPDLGRDVTDGYLAEKRGWAMPSRYPPGTGDVAGTARAKAALFGRASAAGEPSRQGDGGAGARFASAPSAPSQVIGGRGHV